MVFNNGILGVVFRRESVHERREFHLARSFTYTLRLTQLTPGLVAPHQDQLSLHFTKQVT